MCVKDDSYKAVVKYTPVHSLVKSQTGNVQTLLNSLTMPFRAPKVTCAKFWTSVIKENNDNL